MPYAAASAGDVKNFQLASSSRVNVNIGKQPQLSLSAGPKTVCRNSVAAAIAGPLSARVSHNIAPPPSCCQPCPTVINHESDAPRADQIHCRRVKIFENRKP